jgi:hypothetical protein
LSLGFKGWTSNCVGVVQTNFLLGGFWSESAFLSGMMSFIWVNIKTYISWNIFLLPVEPVSQSFSLLSLRMICKNVKFRLILLWMLFSNMCCLWCLSQSTKFWRSSNFFGDPLQWKSLKKEDNIISNLIILLDI